MIEQAFKVLGIEITKDEKAIKNAYREKLLYVNPEDDPEGFKKLRESYERALRYIAEEVKEKDEIDLWIDKLAEIYGSMKKRCNPDSYKALFNDEICQNWEKENLVKERFLCFVADHCNYPQKVFQLFDEVFSIKETETELKEDFNPRFIDYLLNQAKYHEFLNYDLFEYTSLDEKEADYDSFIDAFFEIKNLVEQKEIDKASEAIDKLKDSVVYHPYLDVEQLRIYSEKNNNEKALEIAEGLMAKYEQDMYISYMCAELFYNNEDYDRAMKIFERLIEQNKDHYSANYFVIKNMLRLGDCENAKKRALKLYDKYNGDESIIALLKEINEVLIEKYSEKYKISGKTEDALEYAWCLFQNNRYDTCIPILKSIQKEIDGEYEFINIYGRVLFASGQHEEAYPYLEKWNQMIVEAVDDGSELYVKKKEREADSYYLLALCNLKLKKYDKCTEYLYKSLEIEKNMKLKLEYMEKIARCHIEMKENEKAVDMCDEIISIDKNYYPAYLNRQEAFFNLNNGRGVIDDYFNAIDIWDGYAKPYILAAKTYYRHKQYDDVFEVCDRAKKAGVESRALELERIKALRITVDNEELQNISKMLEEFENAERNIENSDLEGIDKVIFERALAYADRKCIKEALECCKKAVELAPDNIEYLWNLGDFYYKSEDYGEALEIYKKVSNVWSKNVNIYIDLGKTYAKLNDYDTAEEQFKKAAEMDIISQEAHFQLSELYKEKYFETNDRKIIMKAIREETIQLKIEEHPYYYKRRGDDYLLCGLTEKALEDCKKAHEIDPDDLYALKQLGYVYHVMSDYENAIKYYLQGIDIMENDKEAKRAKPKNLYHHLAITYAAIGEYDKAEKYYLKNLELFPMCEYSFDKLFNMYMRIGEYEKVRKLVIRRSKEKDAEGKNFLSENSANLKMLLIKTRELKDETSHRELLTYINEDAESLKNSDLIDLSEALIESYGDFEGALKCIEYQGKRNLPDWERMINNERKAKSYFYMGRKELAAEWARNALKIIEEEYTSINDFVYFADSCAWRLGFVGRLYAYIGDTEKAFYYINQMTFKNKCHNCDMGNCHERYLWSGLIYDCLGDIEKAKENYNKVIQVYPNNPDATTLLKMLTERSR